MSWQDDVMAEQEAADALNYMGEAEWRDMYEDTDGYKKAREKAYHADYWKKNKEKIRQQRKKHYEKNRERIVESNKKWLRENREYWNAYQREYRRRRKEEHVKGQVDKHDDA